jgi:hypothetical protein
LTLSTTKAVPLPSRNRRAPLARSASLDTVRARLMPQPAAIEQGDPFLLGGQRHRLRAGVAKRAVDKDAVPGIRHIGELGDFVAAQEVIEFVLPARRAAVAVGHLRILR